jgi:hypothetical protein
MTGTRANPTHEAMEALAQAFGVKLATLVDTSLDDLALRSELSRAALREAETRGVRIHPKSHRYLESTHAPVTPEDWARLSEILEIAERPRARITRGAKTRSQSRKA